MDVSKTQFFIAATGMLGLCSFGLSAIYCIAFAHNTADEQVFRDVLLLVAGALATATGAATAFFFRTNGVNK